MSTSGPQPIPSPCPVFSIAVRTEGIDSCFRHFPDVEVLLDDGYLDLRRDHPHQALGFPETLTYGKAEKGGWAGRPALRGQCRTHPGTASSRAVTLADRTARRRSLGAELDVLLGFMALVLMVGAMIGIIIFFDDGSPPPLQRPKGISKESWKQVSKSAKEHYRRHRGPESGGGGWSGGDGGDGGGGGD